MLQVIAVGLAFLSGFVPLGPTASRHCSPRRLHALLELGILAAILPTFFGPASSLMGGATAGARAGCGHPERLRAR